MNALIYRSLLLLLLVAWSAPGRAADAEKPAPPITDSIGMRLVKIPAGAFMTGQSRGAGRDAQVVSAV